MYQQKKAKSDTLEGDDDNKFIIFYLGEELYGTPLTDTREVVEVIPTKSVPNTIESFLGVCNLRGQIVGVIDLRARFHIGNKSSRKGGVYFVFDVSGGVIAALVDAIYCVDVITPDSIEANPNIVSRLPLNHILGIAKYKSNLVTLVDFKSILSNEELTTMENELDKAS